MTRAVSTVVDVALALLLVTAAVGVLVSAGTGTPPSPDAAPAAETLATTSVAVKYSLSPGARHGPADRFGRVDGPGFRRTARGTLVTLLADAAVGNLSVRGTQVTHSGEGFAAATRLAVANATDRRTAVRATWAPYPGAPVSGVVRAGARPPANSTVGAVTVTVDSGCPAVGGEGHGGAHGFDAVARETARAIVRCQFPPRRTRLALAGDYPVDALVRHRYRRFAALLGADLGGAIASGHVHDANARLTRPLADVLARDLRRRFDSPSAAAGAVDVTTVRVVVRRWH